MRWRNERCPQCSGGLMADGADSRPAGDEAPTRKRQARREATEQAIRAAVWSILSEEGFSGLRINRVAREAGVSKELIYRYFGDLPSLVLAAIGDRDYWLTERIESTARAAAGKGLGDMVKAMVMDHAETLL